MTTWKELYDDLLQELALYQEELKMTPQQGMRYLTRAVSEFQRLTAIAQDTKVVITAGDLTATSSPYPVSNDILEVVELLDSSGYVMLPVSYQQYNDIVERTAAGEIGFNEVPAHYSRLKTRPTLNNDRWALDADRGMARMYTVFSDQMFRYPAQASTIQPNIVANGTNVLGVGQYYRLTNGVPNLTLAPYLGNFTIIAPVPNPANLTAPPIGTVIRITTAITLPNTPTVQWQPVTTTSDAWFTIKFIPQYDIYSSVSPQWTAWWASENAFELNFATLTPPLQLTKWAPAFVSYAAGQYLRSQNVLSGQQPLWQQYDQEFRQYVDQAIMFKPVQSHELSSPYNISPYSN